MALKQRIAKLEKKMCVNLLPWIQVIVDEDEDEEAVINEKLKAEGMIEGQCNLIIQKIISPKHGIEDRL